MHSVKIKSYSMSIARGELLGIKDAKSFGFRVLGLLTGALRAQTLRQTSWGDFQEVQGKARGKGPRTGRNGGPRLSLPSIYLELLPSSST